ncbi:MAG: tetratricopeptide repeat protein [Bacteroidales bacterium]|nr:tetratricopeptide repeat protein [Bacteroidales bacterium]
MKKFALYFLISLVTISVSAQKQTGYVRTIHKSNKPATYIKGVSISTKENANNIKSVKGGYYEIPVKTINNKKGYTITSVKLDGYNLVDEKDLYRFQTYTLSPKDIILISKADEEKQTKSLMEKLRKTLKQEYEKKQKELEGRYSELEQLNTSYEQQLKDLPDLVKRLVYLDYKTITDELDEKIANAYEEGDFAEAVRLINQKPDLKTRSKENLRLQKEVEQTKQTIIRECDIKIEYFKSIYQNDSVLYYMEIKLEQEPENINSYKELGFYYRLSDNFQNSVDTYKKAINIIRNRYNTITNLEYENNYDFKNLRDLYRLLSRTYSSFEYFDSAEHYQNLYLQSSKKIDMEWSVLSELYANREDHRNAINYTKKIIHVTEDIFGESDSLLILQYYNIGRYYRLLYEKEGRCEDTLVESITYLKKALNTARNFYKTENNSDVATIYNEVAQCWNDVYDTNKDEYSFYQASYFYNTALKIYENTIGVYNSQYAKTLNNIGNLLISSNNYEEALKYFSYSLQIKDSINYDNKMSLIRSYYAIALCLSKLGQYEQAISFYEKILYIGDIILSEEEKDIYSNEIKLLKQELEEQERK